MATDSSTSLPIRTENNGDVVSQLCDGTVASQKLAIDAAGKIGTKLSDGAGTALSSVTAGSTQALDVAIRKADGTHVDPTQVRALTASDVITANQGAANTAANGWPVKPTDGTNSQSYTASGEAKVSVTQALPTGANTIGAVTQAGTWNQRLQDGSGNAISSTTVGAKQALDVALKDGSGNGYTTVNPLPVAVTNDRVGDEINDFNESTGAVAAGATSNHDYTVPNGKTFTLTQIEAAGSGKMRIEVQVEGPALTFTTKFVKFNSVASPNIELKLESPITVAQNLKVRIIRKSLEVALTQSLYSTISGQEV